MCSNPETLMLKYVRPGRKNLKCAKGCQWAEKLAGKLLCVSLDRLFSGNSSDYSARSDVNSTKRDFKRRVP